MKPLDRLKRQQRDLEKKIQRLEALPDNERDMDWFDNWSYLQSHLTRVNLHIQQEEAWLAKSN